MKHPLAFFLFGHRLRIVGRGTSNTRLTATARERSPLAREQGEAFCEGVETLHAGADAGQSPAFAVQQEWTRTSQFGLL